MDVEKAGSKGYGFLNLFDWSKKSRKRLFANGSGSGSSEKSGDGKEVDGGTPSSRSNLIIEDDSVGVSSMKGSSEHSCASSVIDEEGHGRRCPGVVARLMGLDSIPTASTSESYSMPLTASQSFRNNLHDERVAGAYIGGHLNLVSKGAESYPKMPSSPIDRFKMEALPSRSAKAFSVAQYKLLSPMKNHAYVSGRNAADIMEAASKIIGPGFENISSYRVRDVGYASPVRVYNPREMVKVPQRSPKLNGAMNRHEGPASSRSLGGKPLNRRLKNSENTASSRTSQSSGADPAGLKVKGKATSPVARAINGQGRGGISKNNRKVVIHQDLDEHRIDETSGPNHHKSSNQRSATTSSSNVLVQNNRKQNTMVGKHKVNSKPAVSSRQQDKVRLIDASPRKVRAASTRAASSNGGNRKEDSQSTNLVNKRLNSTAKTISKPRRLPEGRRMYSEKSQSSDKIVVNGSQRRIQHNIVIDEQSAWSRDNKRISTEIVSFTFTSPVDKSLPGSHFANQVVETQFVENGYSGSSSNTLNAKQDVIDGDYLGLLLEQKLRELTSGARSPYSKSIKGIRISDSSSVLEDTSSACETSSVTSADHERESLKSFKDEQVDFSQTDIASQNDQLAESMGFMNNVKDQKESEHLHLSPLSILEASLSTETCSSSESWKSANGTRLFVSNEGTKTFNSIHLSEVPEVDAQTEYSDTASSITVTTAEIPPSEISSSCHIDSYGQELEFVREILNASSLSDNICSHCLQRSGNPEILDSLLLEELNDNIRLVAGDEEVKDFRMRRRLLFDCVNEFLNTKCTYYFNAGYRSWFKGVATLQKLSAEELYREMTDLKVAEEWMVDELVDKEMSSPLGKWVDFEIESYEAGGEIEMELVSSLIDEMVADFLTEVLL